jgi:hypothetical protein
MPRIQDHSASMHAFIAAQGHHDQSAGKPALATLQTPEGPVLIRERRRRPREAAVRPAPKPNAHCGSPPMAALGGLIIIGVLVGSYTTKYDLALGHLGGPLAFPAIGFLALQLFLARAAYRLFHDARAMPSLAAFVEYRMLRYCPAVIPAVLFGFVLCQIVGLTCFHARASSLPANLAMLADVVGVPDIDPSHWRLKIELLLSLVVGMACFGPARHHLAKVLLVGLGVTALYVHGEPARLDVLTARGLLTADGYLPLFAFGIALHRAIEAPSSWPWRAVAGLSTLLVFRANTPVHGAVVVASLGLLTAIALGHLRILGRSRVLVSLGNLAFPIYVVHYVAGFAVIHRLEGAGASPIVAMLAASALAVALGVVVNRMFERPALAHGPAVLARVIALGRSRLALARASVEATRGFTAVMAMEERAPS